MQRQFSRAGGFFIALGVIGGFIFGISRGEPLAWALVGTAAGAAVAILLWLVDRRR